MSSITPPRSRRLEHNSWYSLRSRCRNPKDHAFHNYGGRGIKVCERWESFENFLADMGPRPSPKHSIDRIDVNGDYCPENCRWATRQEQNSNRRDCHYLTHNGETLTVYEWARRTGLSDGAIRYRMKQGWSVAKTLTTPATITGKRHREESHCARGHEWDVHGYTNPNTHERYCRVCARISQEKYWARQRKKRLNPHDADSPSGSIPVRDAN